MKNNLETCAKSFFQHYIKIQYHFSHLNKNNSIFRNKNHYNLLLCILCYVGEVFVRICFLSLDWCLHVFCKLIHLIKCDINHDKPTIKCDKLYFTHILWRMVRYWKINCCYGGDIFLTLSLFGRWVIVVTCVCPSVCLFPSSLLTQ